MRYTLLFIALLCFTGNAFAQQGSDQESEKESSVFQKQEPLPEAGDFALGFDAVPFLEYVGNIFNNTTNNSVGANFVGNNQQIMGKYFLSDDMAIRGRLRVMQDNSTNRNRVIQDNQPISSPNVEVTDEWKEKNTFIRLGGGVEYRRGEGRLMGVYGAEISLLYSNYSADLDYGNPITATNQTPTTTNGVVGPNNTPFTRLSGGNAERLVSKQADKQFGVGLNGFVGVEYFIAPKISVGAEFTLGVDYMKNKRIEDAYEFWNTATNSVEEVKYVSEGGSQFQVLTGNYNGSINLMFYF